MRDTAQKRNLFFGQLWFFFIFLLVGQIFLIPAQLFSQQRLKTYPNYDRYEKISKEIREVIK
ncbi:MAG TPA: hypothetical protein ENO29_04880, partial [Candidatus Aminicenantes bacterium]|nr:hypothetical protein [Candidatus Aminicenantes bacterium]